MEIFVWRTGIAGSHSAFKYLPMTYELASAAYVLILKLYTCVRVVAEVGHATYIPETCAGCARWNLDWRSLLDVSEEHPER